MRNEYILSSAIGTGRIPKFQPNNLFFGRAHYSWTINAQLYFNGLRDIRDVKEVLAPDIYQCGVAEDLAGLPTNVTHLACKPIELLRPLFGRKNVAIIVWEFAEFSDKAINEDPRNNQLHMLRQMDEVWCGSTFTQKNLAGLGIRAHYLPPPVAHANLPRLKTHFGARAISYWQ